MWRGRRCSVGRELAVPFALSNVSSIFSLCTGRKKKKTHIALVIRSFSTRSARCAFGDSIILHVGLEVCPVVNVLKDCLEARS